MSQSEVVKQMKAFAESRRTAADELTEWADALAKLTPEQYEEMMGAKFGADSFVAQMLDKVEAAAHVRLGAQWRLNKALAGSLAEAQRDALDAT